MSEEESNLVQHFRRELKLVGEEERTVEGLVEVARAFSRMGHSGGSASVAIPMLSELLQFKNLTPLTSDPDEWFFHGEDVWGAKGGIWQNRRDSSAFSNDGGQTYYRVDEDHAVGEGVLYRTFHTSAKPSQK
jgi:hypothetical protein